MAQERFYDVIVMGGGSAGCVAAARLSEDPNRRVLLLEAGPDPNPVPQIIADGTSSNRPILESDYVIMYPTERKRDGSEYYPVSGRILGGGSSVNMMGITWPAQWDLDNWGALGNPGWSYEECLPILKRIENDVDFGDSPHHGTEGPITVQRKMSFDDDLAPPMRAFVDRAQQLGYPVSPDRNVPAPEGLAPSASNIKDGIRQSTAIAYIGPARGRENLDIIDMATVAGLDVENGRVKSVRYIRDGQTHTAAADQFVLSAGTYHSPQILQLSGIGPVAELERLGVPVVHPMEGVGGNYMDHAAVNLTFEGVGEFNPDWVVAGFQLLYRSAPDLPTPNFHIYMRAPIGVEGLKPMMPIAVNLVEMRARGRVWLNSTDPTELPVIDDGMLQHPEDIAHMDNALHFMHDFIDHESMRPYYGPLMLPAAGEDWVEYAQSTYDSHHHGSGTCKMGQASDPGAVVDHRLRVHGLENLRIADASVMPVVPHAATNVSVIMIAERMTDWFKQDVG